MTSFRRFGMLSISFRQYSGLISLTQLFGTTCLFFSNFILNHHPQIFNRIQVWTVTRSVENFDLFRLQESGHNFRMMTRCSIVHEDFTIVDSHVKFELFLYSKNVTTFLKSEKVKVLDWPGNSPGLNPIKNLWMVIKNKVAEKQASSAKELG